MSEKFREGIDSFYVSVTIPTDNAGENMAAERFAQPLVENLVVGHWLPFRAIPKWLFEDGAVYDGELVTPVAGTIYLNSHMVFLRTADDGWLTGNIPVSKYLNDDPNNHNKDPRFSSYLHLSKVNYIHPVHQTRTINTETSHLMTAKDVVSFITLNHPNLYEITTGPAKPVITDEDIESSKKYQSLSSRLNKISEELLMNRGVLSQTTSELKESNKAKSDIESRLAEYIEAINLHEVEVEKSNFEIDKLESSIKELNEVIDSQASQIGEASLRNLSMANSLQESDEFAASINREKAELSAQLIILRQDVILHQSALTVVKEEAKEYKKNSMHYVQKLGKLNSLSLIDKILWAFGLKD